MTLIPQATVRRAEQAAWEAYDQARRLGDPHLEQFAAAYTALGRVAGDRSAPVVRVANVEAGA
jgi:hypothetical protein